jgi:hypothetical protein
MFLPFFSRRSACWVESMSTHKWERNNILCRYLFDKSRVKIIMGLYLSEYMNIRPFLFENFLSRTTKAEPVFAYICIRMMYTNILIGRIASWKGKQ